jgi:hypothetical protein
MFPNLDKNARILLLVNKRKSNDLNVIPGRVLLFDSANWAVYDITKAAGVAPT